VAVYKHNYQSYKGPLTSLRLRFLVLPRYAYQRVFASKIFLALFLACFLPLLGGAGLIYLQHNAKALQVLQIPLDELIKIDGAFFLTLLYIQGFLGFLLTTLIGPGLISPDLSNNALPLYLSRPLTRWDYVAGKMAVLVILLSAVSWLPLSLLFLFQSGLEGWGWLWNNLRIEGAILGGSLLAISIISLLALALSAWVKWRPVAGALLFGVFIVGAGFGAAINEILYTNWGYLINIGQMIHTVWTWLFFGETPREPISALQAFAGLLGLCAMCLLLLSKKLRAYEVVRS
jgi:ABC-2 type transport system permease protein